MLEEEPGTRSGPQALSTHCSPSLPSELSWALLIIAFWSCRVALLKVWHLVLPPAPHSHLRMTPGPQWASFIGLVKS